jgi:uncharacterized OB-fold protein
VTIDLAPSPVEAGLFTLEPPALLASCCNACGTLRFPAAAVCPTCRSRDVAHAPLATSGTIFTFSIVRSAPPGYLGTVPYAVGVVELPEGLRVTSTITADDLDAIAIGDAVAFELITLAGGATPVTAFAFRRAEAQ